VFLWSPCIIYFQPAIRTLNVLYTLASQHNCKCIIHFQPAIRIVSVLYTFNQPSEL